jgi:hypothetical protein
MGVDHAGHDDAVARVDLDGALGHGQGRADRGDPVADDQDVAAGQHLLGVVHGEHGAAPEHHRPAGVEALRIAHRSRSFAVAGSKSDPCPQYGQQEAGVTVADPASRCQSTSCTLRPQLPAGHVRSADSG